MSTLTTPRLSQLFLIDLDIESLEKRLLNLRADRNELIPIGTLPKDVLREIFKISAKDDPSGFRVLSRIMRVSRRWRRLTMRYSEFWTRIRGDHPVPWIRWCSRLSRTRPLTIDINPPSLSKETEAKIGKLLDRTIHLKVDNSHQLPPPLPILHSFWSKSTSKLALKTLELTSCDISSIPISRFTDSLRTLVLNGCVFAVDAIQLPFLKVLRITSLGGDLDLDLFLKVLPPLQNLRELSVDVTAGSLDHPEKSASTVSLPRLSLLQLNGFHIPAAAHFIVSSVVTPKSTQLVVNGTTIAGGRQTFLRDARRQDDLDTLTILRIVEHPASLHHEIYAGRTNEGVRPLHTPLVDLEGLIPTLCDSRFRSVQSFTLDTSQTISPKFWKAWNKFSFNASLLDLNLSRSGAKSFICYLSLLDRFPYKYAPHGVSSFFPRLKTLTIRSVDESPEPYPSDWKYFCAVLQRRRDSEMGLVKLTVRGCVLRDRDIVYRCADEIAIKQPKAWF
ncbi:hypothetical protein BDN72DRAFT_846100 [Pluteus cervinus]|uniref:Uncharacterized protein n=1 Tax=Pluteus cervinus TaxID=181527 RepID=A0ACD3AGJ6_9AGAR|nr:hypothetical protein BDN72DRAFT_846100 [Pluteus cervinus]